MKKLIAFALFSLSFISCRNDDKEVHEQDISLFVGKWSLYKAEIESSKTGKIETKFVTDECEKKSIHNFKENEIISTHYGIKKGVCTEIETITRKITLDKNRKLFWYENEEDLPYHIVKISKSELVLEDSYIDRDGDRKPDKLRRFFQRK